MRLDLRALRSFVAVASAGSISSAAQSLHIAQPALSVQIKQLEEQLGAALFDRHPRGVVPTAVGERLLGHAVEILRRVDVAYDDLRQAVDQPSGRVALALPQSVANFVTVPLVQAVVRQWPLIQLQMVELSSGYIPQQLLHGGLQVGQRHEGLFAGVAAGDAALLLLHVLGADLHPQGHALHLVLGELPAGGQLGYRPENCAWFYRRGLFCRVYDFQAPTGRKKGQTR